MSKSNNHSKDSILKVAMTKGAFTSVFRLLISLLSRFLVAHSLVKMVLSRFLISHFFHQALLGDICLRIEFNLNLSIPFAQHISLITCCQLVSPFCTVFDVQYTAPLQIMTSFSRFYRSKKEYTYDEHFVSDWQEVFRPC